MPETQAAHVAFAAILLPSGPAEPGLHGVPAQAAPATALYIPLAQGAQLKGGATAHELSAWRAKTDGAAPTGSEPGAHSSV